ncbi:MAG: transcriptional repressor [Spirochaetales bacterium]|nr:transcriptional repressor [Spirochaetales bacterium]
MRVTKQREIILEQLKTHKDHPSADIIYDEVRGVLSNISLGTVYRNLEWLVAKNLAQKINIGCSKARFDADISMHAHFRCIKCDAVEDVDAVFGFDLIKDKDWMQERLLKGASLEFYGICGSCLAKEGADETC